MSKPANENGDNMLVTMTGTDLKRIIREAIREERQTAPAPEYMSTEDVSEMIGCTVESIRTYCTRDGLPCVRIGKIRRFRREDVIEWLETRRSQPRAHKSKHVAAMDNVRRFHK